MRLLRLTWFVAMLLPVPLQPALADADHSAQPYLLILGTAQDAGYPQAGCYRPHCLPGWQDRDARITASSIAVVVPAEGKAYVFDATPHLPDQLYRLHAEAPEASLAGIFLTHAHIGHYTGLMHLGHEAMGAKGVPVYAMPRMRRYLETNGPWSQLVDYENIALTELLADESVEIAGDIRVTPFRVPHRDEYSETVGFRIDGPRNSAVFLPDIDKWERWDRDIRELVVSVDHALLDATFFADGELKGRAMRDIPHPFVSESMALFDALDREDRARVVFIHMNHTNPMLDPDSDASRDVLGRGYRIAREGMKLSL